MCKREKERVCVCVDEEAIELMACDVGATPWEPGPEMGVPKYAKTGSFRARAQAILTT